MSGAHRIGFVVAFVAALTCGARALHADSNVPVFVVRVSACPKLPPVTGAFGNGFVVTDFMHGGGAVLVTALHVVYSCTDIAISRANCQTGRLDSLLTLDSRSFVQTWPSLDLAAFTLTPEDLNQLGLANTTLSSIDLTASTLDRIRTRRGPAAQYDIPATSETTVCPRGFATHVNTLNAGAQFNFLSGVLRQAAEGLRGSIASSTMLLTYLGTPTAGASGAPVLMDNRIIGIHEAGFKEKDSGWAIILSGATLTNPPPSNMITAPWPAFSVPMKFPQSGVIEDADDYVRRAIVRVRSAQNFVSLAGGLTAQPRYARTDFDDSVGSEYRFRYALHPGVWELGDTEFVKLGFYLELDYSRMRLPRTFRAPDHTLVESDLVHAQGWGTGGGIDVRLERLDSFWSPTFSVGGVIGAWFHQANLEASDDVTGFAGGITSELVNRNPIGVGTQLLYALYGLRASYLFMPTLDYSYTGVGATYTRSRDDFALTIALQLGVEW